MNVGDTVKLTGSSWEIFNLTDAEVTITSISAQRDPWFTFSDGGEYVIFTEGDVDYSATLVRSAGVTTYTQADLARAWEEGVRAKSDSISIFDRDVLATNPYKEESYPPEQRTELMGEWK